MKRIQKLIITSNILIVILLLTCSSSSSTITNMLENPIQSSSSTESSQIIIKDIYFGFGKIVAHIENTGDSDITAEVSFSASKGSILPVIIGSHDVLVLAGELRSVSQRFNGFGFYTFHVRVDTGDSACFDTARGLWLFLFGIQF